MISNVRSDQEKPLGYRDILDWSELTGNIINPDECAIIFSMDAEFRETLAEEIKANTARAEARRGKR